MIFVVFCSISLSGKGLHVKNMHNQIHYNALCHSNELYQFLIHFFFSDVLLKSSGLLRLSCQKSYYSKERVEFRNRGENKKFTSCIWSIDIYSAESQIEAARIIQDFHTYCQKYSEIFGFLVLFISQVKHYQLCHLVTDDEF